MQRIKAIVVMPEVGETYWGASADRHVGAFVEILPQGRPAAHLRNRLETIRDHGESGLKEGDEIEVKLIGVDPKTGKLKLSHKVLVPARRLCGAGTQAARRRTPPPRAPRQIGAFVSYRFGMYFRRIFSQKSA
ncbi:MAG: S1 RNA-binding domain-containing protein [Alistipes sp.]